MDFFKSVFTDDPEEHSPDSQPESNSQDLNPPSPSTHHNPNLSSITSAWTFGSSFIKTLASRSESVIETYRRDLQEFGAGLKNETAVIREVASRAVKDLPSSLEAGASAAQGSLESVGQVIDNLGNTVTDIIAHGKESVLAGDSDSETSDAKSIGSSQLDRSSKPYSRLDAQIRSLQSDVNTYCEEPEDLDEYNEWKLGFSLNEGIEEIEDKELIEYIYKEIVPVKVDHETFWIRYFYRVYKVKKAEETRTKLVNRAISGDQEEELTWDVDEDDYEQSDGSKLNNEQVEEIENTKNVSETEEHLNTGSKLKNEQVKEIENTTNVSETEEHSNTENVNDGISEIDQIGSSNNTMDKSESIAENSEVKSDDSNKMNLEPKNENAGSGKDSDFSVVSSQHSPEEEDLGWDEIEDIGSGDENTKADIRGSPNRGDLRRRLSTPEDEEELTWDIEDDDEPIRS